MSNWVDYKQLREQLDFFQVLQHYKVDVKRRGTQVIGICPLPGHPRQGAKASPSFSVSLEKRIFQCFGCGGKGNVLDFIALMERCDPRNPVEFRKAAIHAQRTFIPNPSIPPAQKQAFTKSTAFSPPKVPLKPFPGPSALPAIAVNEPLDFELKHLDAKPKYLLDRGFTERTITHFGLGYCTKGYFAGRVVIPLHDARGRLIGYAGRLIFDDAVDEQNPKYLFPAKRERNGRILEFAKSLFVYNGHRIQRPVQDLIIVQGFPAAWWLWQQGHHDVVALMGAHCSVDQAKIIINLASPTGRVWFLTDGTKDGERCAERLFFDVGPSRFCKWVKLAEYQPTEYSPGELSKMLEWKIHA